MKTALQTLIDQLREYQSGYESGSVAHFAMGASIACATALLPAEREQIEAAYKSGQSDVEIRNGKLVTYQVPYDYYKETFDQ